MVELKARRRDAAAEVKRARAALPKGTKVPEPARAAAALARAQQASAKAQEAESAAQAAVGLPQKPSPMQEAAAASADAAAEGMAKNQQGAQERAASGTVDPHDKPREESCPTISRARSPAAAMNSKRRRKHAGKPTSAVDRARQARDEAQHAFVRAHLGSISGFDQESATARTAARMASEPIARLVESQSLPAFPAEEGDRARTACGVADLL